VSFSFHAVAQGRAPGILRVNDFRLSD